MSVRLALGIIACVGISACASTRKFAMNDGLPANFESRRILNTVPFVAQKSKQCGPAALSMILNYYRHSVTAEALESTVFTSTGDGSLQSDMISGARRQGYMAHTVNSFADIVREVESGRPVIVFTNLALKWFPQWHYAVVVGYDLERQKVYLHSGPDALKEMDYSIFSYQWQLASKWALVVYPPNENPVSGTELARMSSAAALESIGSTAAAESAYKAILNKWPQSLGPMIGLGNIYFASSRWQESVEILKRAVKFHPASLAAKNNLQVAQQRLSQHNKRSTQFKSN